MEDIFDRLSGMDPESALAEITAAAKKLFQNLDEDAQSHFLMSLLDMPAGDKVSSLVHL